MDIVSRLKKKDILFLLLAISGVFCFISALVYAICFAKNDDFSPLVIVFLSIGFASILGGLLTPFVRYFRYLPLACSWAAFLTFIYKTYYYISVVFIGIDADSFSPQFIVSLVLILLTSILSIVTIFMPLKEGK